ncbi:MULTISPECIES: MFS transporter [unclassified Pseudomonas]|uniref:MFS transporter n=1 Tax=unclassified Pseudomonas TaxID=196821 RepID=UPI00384F647E
MNSSSISLVPLYWLALGTFAVGTESFMLAGLLPDIATDLATTVVATGQLVTVFALAYAFSSPILTALTGRVSRRTLMIFTLLGFTLANLIAFMAPDYWVLMFARVLLAFTAGLFVPGANALAGAIAGPDKRGTALAIVNGGITLAVAFGVPLGSVVGEYLGWRMTFAGVAALSAMASLGLIVGLPADIGHGLPVASLRERLETARRPVILLSLLVTTLWATGAYTVYTYLALFIVDTTSLTGSQVGYVFFAWGVAAGVGVIVGGKLVDRLGARRVIPHCLTAMIISFVILSLSADTFSVDQALVPVVVGVLVWGVAHWSFYPAQQAGLIGIAGIKGTPIALSLNASFMYLGFSLGAALGSLTLGFASVTALGWVAAGCEVSGLILHLLIRRKVSSSAALVCAV